MWTIASGDEALGLVYLPMGNASADYYSSVRRPPENEFATSLVALDVTTGKPRWHFQAVKKDVWDYDFGAQARSEEHTSELQSLMRISYAVFCLKNKKTRNHPQNDAIHA